MEDGSSVMPGCIVDLRPSWNTIILLINNNSYEIMNGFVSMSSGISLGLSSKRISSLSSRCVPIPRIGSDFRAPHKLSAFTAQCWNSKAQVTKESRDKATRRSVTAMSGRWPRPGQAPGVWSRKGCKGQEARDKSLSLRDPVLCPSLYLLSSLLTHLLSQLTHVNPLPPSASVCPE